MKLIYNNEEIELIECKTFFKRLLGVMFKKKISHAYLFRNCNSVHTYFVKQKIDIIMTDKNNKIIYFKTEVPKNKVIMKKDASHTYETPSNYFTNLKIGKSLIIK